MTSARSICQFKTCIFRMSLCPMPVTNSCACHYVLCLSLCPVPVTDAVCYYKMYYRNVTGNDEINSKKVKLRESNIQLVYVITCGDELSKLTVLSRYYVEHGRK